MAAKKSNHAKPIHKPEPVYLTDKELADLRVTCLRIANERKKEVVEPTDYSSSMYRLSQAGSPDMATVLKDAEAIEAFVTRNRA